MSKTNSDPLTENLPAWELMTDIRLHKEGYM